MSFLTRRPPLIYTVSVSTETYRGTREPKPLSFELILEHTVLLDEIIDDHLLLVVKPSGQGNYQGDGRVVER